MTQEWYYSVDGGRQGPVAAADLKKLADAGTLKADDLVWKDGMADWAPAKSIKGLFGGAAAAAAPTAARSGEQKAARVREAEERPNARAPRDEEADDRPSRRRRDEDEEDDRPSGRVRRRDEDEERPSRRGRDDEDEDRPRKRRGGVPEDVGGKKLTAGLIGIIAAALGFGWIGIHKFMLGKSKAGLIMLLGSVLTCFIGAIVFNVISLIEGIIYLTKSDEEFYELYVVGDKEWF